MIAGAAFCDDVGGPLLRREMLFLRLSVSLSNVLHSLKLLDRKKAEDETRGRVELSSESEREIVPATRRGVGWHCPPLLMKKKLNGDGCRGVFLAFL